MEEPFSPSLVAEEAARSTYMKKPRQVAVILDATSPYQRKIIRGIAAYARQAGPWRLYVEEDPLEKLPDLRSWQGHGIITAFTERRFASLVHGLDLPVVGVEGGYGWYEPKSGIPYVRLQPQQR